MGQGAPPPCIPIVPVGTRLCPSRGEHRAPPALGPGKLRGEQELPPPVSQARGHREGPAPSPSPTRLIAMVRAAERPGGTRDVAGSGEGMRTCLKPRIHPRRAGSCLWGGARRELPSLASGASSARAGTSREESCAHI